jgi:amidase
VASDQGLVRATACAIVDKLNSGEVTPLDLLDVLESRIAEVDGKVNALPTLCFDRARIYAKALMEMPAGERGLLAGLPVPIKDLTNVEGVLTTQGSPIFKDTIATQSDIVVEHLEYDGAVIYAKSNTPEFGAGAHTFNEVFGATRNPWDTSRSAAGSSGGAAVALATGMAWLAHGTDMGGSLRNPASFCGVVGMRPSIGRVAHTPAFKIDRNLTVHGPMARNVEDLALLLDAMSGEHPADPLSLPFLPTSFLTAARSGKKPKRIAYSPDLGITPVDPEVAAITRKAALRFAEAGAIVEEAHPDLREAHDCFHVLRAFDFAISKAALLRTRRDMLKPEVIWNIEEGLKLTVERLERAEAQRVAMTARTLEFFGTYDLLLTPATIVAPFPIENRYVAECAGKKFDNYVEWLGIVYAITLVCCPALSLPCGFTGIRPAGRTSGGGGAARRGTASRRRQGAGGYSGCARHHADRPTAGEVTWHPSAKKRLFCQPGRPSFVLQLEEHRQRQTVDHFRFIERDKFRLVQNRVTQRAEHHLKREADAPHLRRGPATAHPRKQ